ncbi:unnamed protein product [Notodromas monacha]|uniref:Uncharacterized protein n=1 Tax=Notodromas monacha TaxID=399045 RepID=A0A7R9BMI7_9CRUS|nr:unnamed protein product [Notodromas monacha]CAG0916890.1 unnamed protein product [Notodromas monacha]
MTKFVTQFSQETQYFANLGVNRVTVSNIFWVRPWLADRKWWRFIANTKARRFGTELSHHALDGVIESGPVPDVLGGWMKMPPECGNNRGPTRRRERELYTDVEFCARTVFLAFLRKSEPTPKIFILRNYHRKRSSISSVVNKRK